MLEFHLSNMPGLAHREDETFPLVCEVVKVVVHRNPPSIVAEDDRVDLRIIEGSVPGHARMRYLRIWFDENNIPFPKSFTKGEEWKVELGPDDELLWMWPRGVPPPRVLEKMEKEYATSHPAEVVDVVVPKK